MNDPVRGTVEQFDVLHSLLVQVTERELRRCLESGETPPAALLAQARQFLADNDVKVPAKTKRIDDLAAVMPDFSDDGPPKFTPKE